MNPQPLPPHRLVAEPIHSSVSWLERPLITMPILRAERSLADCVGIDPSRAQKPYYARCRIELECGTHRAALEEGKRWNGADFPRWTWSLFGWSPHDPRALLGSGFHDDGCERDDVPQVMADAVFVTLLRPVVFEQTAGDEVVSTQMLEGIGEFRAAAGYLGVRTWSLFKAFRRWAERVDK